MKLLVLIGLILGGISFADETATTETAAICLTEDAVKELTEAGHTCTALVDGEGVALETVTCTMEDADDVVLTLAACEIKTDDAVTTTETAKTE